MNGSDFRKWRREREITQQEVADYVGCVKSTICRWEKQQYELSETYAVTIVTFMATRN